MQTLNITLPISWSDLTDHELQLNYILWPGVSGVSKRIPIKDGKSDGNPFRLHITRQPARLQSRFARLIHSAPAKRFAFLRRSVHRTSPFLSASPPSAYGPQGLRPTPHCPQRVEVRSQRRFEGQRDSGHPVPEYQIGPFGQVRTSTRSPIHPPDNPPHYRPLYNLSSTTHP